ncbi:MAG: antibiotic biosynthesis monooxygenase [Alphaproteobacteria bacterium]|nr:antibiotic biosynthesis monooxygenase [Alphaproteobacteria bacterium]
MIAVIFEFWPKEGQVARYLDVAAEMRRVVEKIDGFISVERFESIYEKGKYVSLSFWRDEAAVRAWREQLDHRAAQDLGRAEIFARYRLRVAAVLRDYGHDDRAQAPSR